MAPSSSSAMKSSLVLLLLLSAVVTSQAHQVACTNRCNKPIKLNGMVCPPGGTISLPVNVNMVLGVIDVTGKLLEGEYKCPNGVEAMDIFYENKCVYLKITKVLSLVGGLLNFLLGLLIPIISPCTL